MDERKGRRTLDQLGISKIGTIGILLRAKRMGIIESLRAELERLQQYGFSVNQSILEEVVKQAGE